jgi:hypothetical protein
MDNDNIGNFFDPDEFEREDDNKDDDGEGWKPDKIFAKELFRKSIEILNLTDTICSMLPGDEEEDDQPGFIQRMMKENAMIIPPKIKGAMAMDAYSLKMENAVIIKINICQLKLQLWSCEALHGLERKYVDVMRTEIEAFREIFVKWVTSFDKTNDYPDEWHLFNDPSTFPQDDEPFNAQDFLDNFDPDDE